METETVYLDVLVCTNLLINYLLLLVTSRMAGRAGKKARLFLAAALGALSSLLILLPPIGFLGEMAARVLTAFVIAFAAFPWKTPRIYGKTVFCFFAVSMGFAGVMFALWMFLAPQSMYIANGVVYFDISAVMLVLLSLAAYVILTVFHRIFKIHPLSHKVYDVQVEKDGKTVRLRGYLDTGNTLRDPFLGTPVAVCPMEKIWGVIPGDVLAYYQCIHEKKEDNSSSVLVKNCCGARMIPFQTVGGSGLLVAFRPDRFTISDGETEKEVEDILIGIADGNVGDGSYDVLLCRDIAT